jgi:hypothetical protein
VILDQVPPSFSAAIFAPTQRFFFCLFPLQAVKFGGDDNDESKSSARSEEGAGLMSCREPLPPGSQPWLENPPAFFIFFYSMVNL